MIGFEHMTGVGKNIIVSPYIYQKVYSNAISEEKLSVFLSQTRYLFTCFYGNNVFKIIAIMMTAIPFITYKNIELNL